MLRVPNGRLGYVVVEIRGRPLATAVRRPRHSQIFAGSSELLSEDCVSGRMSDIRATMVLSGRSTRESAAGQRRFVMHAFDCQTFTCTVTAASVGTVLVFTATRFPARGLLPRASPPPSVYGKRQYNKSLFFHAW